MANLQDIADFDRENPYTPRTSKPALIPLQSNGNCANMVEFQQLCDQHSIKPEFTFTQVCEGGFTAKVSFATNIVEINEPRQGKKAAKEALCSLAIPRLPAVDKASRKRKSSETARSAEPEENWVGILLGKHVVILIFILLVLIAVTLQNIAKRIVSLCQNFNNLRPPILQYYLAVRYPCLEGH